MSGYIYSNNNNFLASPHKIHAFLSQVVNANLNFAEAIVLTIAC